MKKIAILAPSVPPVSEGGIASSHLHLAKMLKKQGFFVRIFTFSDFGISIPADEDRRWIQRNGSPKGWVFLIKLMTSFWFKAKDSDWGARAYQTADILKAAWGAWKCGRALEQFQPEVVFVPDQSLPGFWIRKRPHQKWIQICHHNANRFVGNSLLGVHSVSDAQQATAFEQATLSKVDAVICPSDYMAKVFAQTFRFSGEVRVIPNLIDSELIAAVECSKLSEHLKWVYIPAAGSTFKGAEFIPALVEKMLRRSSVPLGFYLSGDVTAEQLSKIKSSAPNAEIVAPGRLPYSRHIALVKACHICVSPTLIENFSMALLEARICGLSVATYDVGGNSEVLSFGKGGAPCKWVPYLDLEALASAGCDLTSLSHSEPLVIQWAEPIQKYLEVIG